MKQLTIFFLILTSTLFAQWQIDESFPSRPQYTLYEEFFHPVKDTLIVIERYSPPPPPIIENYIIYVKDVSDTSWEMIYNNDRLYNIYYKNSKLAFAVGFYLSKSTNGGVSWQQIHDFWNDFPDASAQDVYFKDEQNGYVAGGLDLNHSFFGRSQNGGISWDFNIISGPMFCRNIVMTNDSTLFITGLINGAYERIYKSTDYGSTWGIKNDNSIRTILKLYFFDEEYGWALGTLGKIMKTTDAGENWQDVSSGSTDSYRDCIFFSQNIGWVAGSKNGYEGFRPLIRTSDGGATWQNSLDVSDIIHILFINPDTGYVMTKYEIYKTTNGGGFPTESNSERRNLKSFNLSQNYPNPFNPVSTIEYEIPARGYVTLKIYDILGNEVATLVNEEKPAGNYTVKFDGGKLVSGIYLYQLRAGDFTATKKLILLK